MSTTTRFSSRVAAAFITDRRALATRPPRPITRPRSSSATSSSSTTSPSISSTSFTSTASGSATSERARNSSSSRTGCPQPLSAGCLDPLGAEERRNRPGGLSALLEPVAGPVLVDDDQRRVALRVVLADRLDRAAVPRRALVGDHNPPDRVLLRPDPAKSDSHGHAAAEVRRSDLAHPAHQGLRIRHLPFGHLLHQLVHLAELLDQAVDGLDRGPGPGGDPLAARAVDLGGMRPLVGSHRLDDRLEAIELPLVDLAHPLHRLAHPGHHLHQVAQRPHAADLLHLREEVVKSELLLADLPLEVGRLVLVELLL